MKLLRKKYFILSVIIVVCAVIGFFLLNSGGEPEHDFVLVEHGNVVQEVSVTGKVQPVEGVDLAFEQSGRVSRISVVVGDNVNTWQSLIRLGAGELTAKLNEAKASLKVEEVKLEELQLGSRAEEVAVKQAELAEAEQDLTNYYKSVLTVLNEAYVKADDAVRIKTGGIFTGYKTSGYEFTYNTCSSQAGIDAAWLRFVSESELDQWKEELNVLDLSVRDVLEEALNIGEAHLTMFQDFLNSVSETLTTSCTIDDTSLNTYRTNITTARMNIVAQLDALSDLEQSISAQKSTVLKEERDLELSRASSTPEKIRAQEAKVEQLEASVENVKAQIEKTILRVPFTGIVTKINARVGEIVDAYAPVVSIISNLGFEIETNIPEVDVAKVKVDDRARVTLDAYGSEILFEAEVVTIDSTETVIEGVSTYTATLHFTKEDERIKSGMTANIDILTAKRENVLFVSQRAVVTRDGEKMLRVLEVEAEVREVLVQTGLRGSDGNIEIIEGVSEGDRVIIFFGE